MKKLLLSLGALSAVVAPVAAVVACGSTDSDADKTHTSTLGVTSTKTAAELKTASVGTDATPVSLGTEFGIPSTQIQGMDGTTYVYDKEALTLTATSVTAGVTMVQTITITPKAAEAPEVNALKNILDSKGSLMTRADVTVADVTKPSNADALYKEITEGFVQFGEKKVSTTDNGARERIYLTRTKVATPLLDAILKSFKTKSFDLDGDNGFPKDIKGQEVKLNAYITITKLGIDGAWLPDDFKSFATFELLNKDQDQEASIVAFAKTPATTK